MKKVNNILKTLCFLMALLCIVSAPSFCVSHIQALTQVRDDIIIQSNRMPPLIRASSANDIRTLERIYELNTSTLTTIEAYFKMIKVVTSSGVELNEDIITSLNEWLEFIHHQCAFDIDYLNEALAVTKDQSTITQIYIAQELLKQLKNSTSSGISENVQILQ
jgi:hypothetical protein